MTYIKNTRTGLWATREEVGYYPCQVRHGAKLLGGAIRSHWGIENSAHYVRDVTLGEDASRIRTRPGIMARMRSVALNVLQAAVDLPHARLELPQSTAGKLLPG